MGQERESPTVGLCACVLVFLYLHSVFVSVCVIECVVCLILMGLMVVVPLDQLFSNCEALPGDVWQERQRYCVRGKREEHAGVLITAESKL